MVPGDHPVVHRPRHPESAAHREPLAAGVPSSSWGSRQDARVAALKRRQPGNRLCSRSTAEPVAARRTDRRQTSSGRSESTQTGRRSETSSVRVRQCQHRSEDDNVRPCGERGQCLGRRRCVRVLRSEAASQRQRFMKTSSRFSSTFDTSVHAASQRRPHLPAAAPADRSRASSRSRATPQIAHDWTRKAARVGPVRRRLPRRSSHDSAERKRRFVRGRPFASGNLTGQCLSRFDVNRIVQRDECLQRRVRPISLERTDFPIGSVERCHRRIRSDRRQSYRAHDGTFLIVTSAWSASRSAKECSGPSTAAVSNGAPYIFELSSPAGRAA